MPQALNRQVRSFLAIALFAAVTGCAAAASADCGPDWFSIGQRDGVLGAQPQDQFYAARCGGGVDAVRYREGWQDGFARRPRPTV
jgi:hypothetical protein